MAIHRITSAGNDLFIGGLGLDEDTLLKSFSVLANDPQGASLYSVHSTMPHSLGGVRHGGTTFGPRAPISILDDGITYTGWAAVGPQGRVILDFSQSRSLIEALNQGDVLTGSFVYVDKLPNGQFSPGARDIHHQWPE